MIRLGHLSTETARAERAEIDRLATDELVRLMAEEDAGVPLAVAAAGAQIAAAVDKLPDRQRTVFTLCQIAEQSTSEVSRSLGLSEATVRVHLFRAMRKLRRLLEHEGTASRRSAGRG